MAKRRKSKLRAMAEAGNPWAIATLAKARALGREAGHRGAAMQREGTAPVKDAAFSQAMRDAKDILEWRLGPDAPGWRVFRLAQALIDGR
jgi:hypothetical protein